MSISDHIPRDYARIEVVESLSVLFDSKAQPHVNARVLPRSIEGDFDGLAWELSQVFSSSRDGVHRDELEEHAAKGSSFKSELAHIIKDMKDCTHLPEHYPALRIIEPNDQCYVRDGVYDFHGDMPCWRVLICYNKPTTAWIRNEDARLMLTSDYHYTLKPGGTEHELMPGHIWRQRGETRYCKPFLHRAQEIAVGHAPRLLLVG